MKFLLLLLAVVGCGAVELTFELPDNAVQCYYEDLKTGVDNILQFEVVVGGQYDVDLTITDPGNNVLYNGIKKSSDTYQWKAQTDGTYKACFSNEFSTISHKIVFLDWQVSDRLFNKDLNAGKAGATHPMGAVENSVYEIAEKMRLVDDYQTHHRLREMTGRRRAEELNERVMLWSLGQSAVIVICALAQVWVLKSFFSDKRTRY